MSLQLFKDFSLPQVDIDFFNMNYKGAGNKQECVRLFDFMERSPRVTRTDEMAYMLATILHECGRDMKPVKEILDDPNTPRDETPWLNESKLRYLKGEKYSGEKHGGKHLYFGRGYTQTTWWENYYKMQKLTGLPLLENPDLLLIPENAFKVMEFGMFDGTFTDGQFKMSKYFYGEHTDFYNSRMIINFMDQAVKISVMAYDFYSAIRLKEAA